MAKVYNYVKSNHPKTQLMASGIREKAQAIQLAGLDYMVISPQLMKVLQETSTLSGFNDGMHGDATTDSIPVMLSPETAAEKAVKKLGDVSQTDFVDELGYLGFDLLKAGVGSAVSNIL
jgi:transaldolase